MSLAAALAAASHHSAQPYAAPRGQTTGTTAREGEVREQYYGLRAPERPLPGMRPAPLSEVLPQVGLQRHTVEQRIVHTPYVQILDAPVPQMVEQLVDFFKDLDVEVPAQVIEVPKISHDIIPQRSVDLVPQMAEQLVEVPTVLTPTRIALRIAEQIVSTPVPRGRVQCFLPVQSSTAISSSGKRLSERTVEQIVDIPSGVGLGQGSSSSCLSRRRGFYWGVFALFPWKKVRSAGQVSADRHVSSWTPAAYGQPRGSIEEEKDELLKREEQEELNSLWAVLVERRTHQQMQRITYLLLKKTGAKKKRKKRRKKKLPKTSSSGGPARRRQRQWHVSGFPGDFSPRAVFPYLSTGPRCSASWPVWIRRTVASRSTEKLDCFST